MVDLRDATVPLINNLVLTCLVNGQYSDSVTAFGCSGESERNDPGNFDLAFYSFLWANPGLFFVYFRSFFKKQFLQQIDGKKCPSSIRPRDSNPQPFKHESSPIATRPGLPPFYSLYQTLAITRI